MSTVERFEGVTVKVEPTDSVYELNQTGIMLDKQIWVAENDENVIDLKVDGDEQNMCNSENVRIEDNVDDMATGDNISFKCSLCSFCSNIQSVIDQHVIEHTSTNSTCQGHFQVKHEENISQVSHLTNGSEYQKMDNVDNVGQGHFNGDSVVVVKVKSVVCQDGITLLEPEVPILGDDVTVTIKSEATPDSDEVNSTEIVCQKCNLKVPGPFAAIHANGHVNMFAGEQCPICNITCKRRTTFTRHLALKHNLNIDGMLLQETVDNNRHRTANKIQKQKVNLVPHVAPRHCPANKIKKQKVNEIKKQKANKINPQTISRANYPYKIKRIVDVQTIISAEEIKWQLEDTRDILRPKDLAPTTKSMMDLRNMWGIGKLFARPSRPMFSKKLFQGFVNKLTTVPVENEDIKTC